MEFTRFEPINKKYEPVLKTYMDGTYDKISDQELDVLLEFFTQLEGFLFVMGKTFDLPWKEANRKLNELRSYKFHREYTY